MNEAREKIESVSGKSILSTNNNLSEEQKEKRNLKLS